MILDFTDAAVADLQGIRNYTLDRWGATKEEEYLDSLWARFEDILESPDRYRHLEDLFPGCQIASHESHKILFRVLGHRLQIVRILHGAMDFRRHIPGDLTP